jgi:hypothetical protein
LPPLARNSLMILLFQPLTEDPFEALKSSS